MNGYYLPLNFGCLSFMPLYLLCVTEQKEVLLVALYTKL